MTFISAFRCDESRAAVIGADTQETIGEYKISVEKLEPVTVGNYHMAIGGAGNWHLVDTLFDYVQEWIEGWDETTERGLIHLLRPKIREFYTTEVAAYPTKSSKVIHAILCLKHCGNPNPLLFELRGTTVRKARDFSFVGFETDILHHLTRRLYQSGMPISRGVLLTVYLFSIVSSTVISVGGESRVVIARETGIRTHEPLFVSKISDNIKVFSGLTDRIALALPDTSVTDEEFEKALADFVGTARDLRKRFIFDMSTLSIMNQLTTPSYPGNAYPMVPGGTTIQVQIKKTGR